MTGRLEGRVAIVTGGAHGIGRAVVSTLASEGAAVVVADIDGAGGEAVAAEVVAGGGEATAVAVDLTDETQVIDLVATAIDRYGTVDILDNNAALTEGDVLARDCDVASMDLAVWDRMFAGNLTTQLLTSKHVLPHMVRSGRGAIVNMSSGAARSGDLTRAAYSASKAAIESFTRSIATQYGRAGVRANTIVPGLIVTASLRAVIPPEALAGYARSMLTPHVGRPQDIADLVRFLVSDESRYITGQAIVIDGGMSVHSAALPEQAPGAVAPD